MQITDPRHAYACTALPPIHIMKTGKTRQLEQSKSFIHINARQTVYSEKLVSRLVSRCGSNRQASENEPLGVPWLSMNRELGLLNAWSIVALFVMVPRVQFSDASARCVARVFHLLPQGCQMLRGCAWSGGGRGRIANAVHGKCTA